MSPVVEYLKLQIRFNPKNRSVELKTSEFTEDPGSIQKGQDFIEAFFMVESLVSFCKDGYHKTTKNG